MRRNIIKVTDKIKDGGWNEDSKDFSPLLFRIQSSRGNETREQSGKPQMLSF